MEIQFQQRNAAFRHLLEGLNPAQRQAVDQTEGPVLVIAGPGTGKTHVLAARIGKILLDTDARAQNVLCLTFTDAGASAMRQRLLDMIGPEAHRVPIYTFHAFCNRVIQENLEFFGRADLAPATDLERIEVVRELLEKLPTDHPLREGRKDVFQFETQLRDLFLTMKKESWAPGFVLRKVDEYLAGLSTHPDFIYQKNTRHGKKGEPKTTQIKAVHEKMERLKAAADLFPKYVNAMQRRGRYEYEDMILWVLRAFDRNEALLRNYQERFQYFLVDEFQDTNGAQNRLLNLLLDYWPNPNVFIVGDDDQSIFEFQGARLQNLLDFYHQHRDDLKTIVLDRNYRSPQDLLDAARRLIEHNDLRAVRTLDQPIDKNLLAQKPELAEPVIRVYDNRLLELTDLVGRIEALLRSGEPAREIAVLYYRHRQSDRLVTLLEKKGIAFSTRRPVNVLELPLIEQFRDLLRYLHDEISRPFSGEHRLFRLLHASWWSLRPLDLALVAAHLKTSPGSWRELTSDPNRLDTLQLSDAGHLHSIAQNLDNWIAAALNLPLPELIERLYTQTGLLRWALNQPDKIWWVQVLSSFLDFVKSEAERDPRFSLGRLLALLDSMDDNRLALPLAQNIREGEAISLLTAHAAKGLEFRHVFLFDCTEDAWEPGARGYAGRFSLPDTLTLSGEEDALEARRRLFYVAATRAKQSLFISYARTGPDGKTLRQARFVDEIGLEKIDAAVAPEAVVAAQSLLLLEPESPVISLPEPALIDSLLRNFTLSITALNRYLRCPLAFYYEDILGVPSAMSEAAAFGEAMHETMRQFFQKIKNEKPERSPGEDALIRLFNHEMERRRSLFSEQAFGQRLALGRGWLRRYFADQIPDWTRRAIVERRIDRVEMEGVPLAGVLDKIEWLNNATIRVVDYKTGAPDLSKVARPSENQPLGGEFWRQLAFYKILLDSSRLYVEPVGSGAIAWLEPDKKGAFPVAEIRFSAEEIHFMEQMIRVTYGKIRERVFTTGCGQEDCAWCRMHRDNRLPEIPERVEESLDDRV